MTQLTKQDLLKQALFTLITGGIAFLAFEGVKSMSNKNKTENVVQSNLSVEAETTTTNEAEANRKKQLEMQKEAEIKERIQYEVKRREMQLKWRDVIRCEKNGGKQLGIAGGFYEVNVRAINDTEHIIDEVIIRVMIYRGLGENKLCHSEIIRIDKVPSEAEKSIKYSHVECGQRMDIDVIGYTCKELKTGYDPFRE